MVHTAANNSAIERLRAHIHTLDRFPRLPVPVFPSFSGPVLSPTIILGDLTALILIYLFIGPVSMSAELSTAPSLEGPSVVVAKLDTEVRVLPEGGQAGKRSARCEGITFAVENMCVCIPLL